MKKILLLMIAGLLFVSFAGNAFAQPAVGVFSESGFKASNPVNLKPGQTVTLDVLYDDMAVNSAGIALADGKKCTTIEVRQVTTIFLQNLSFMLIL